MVFLSFYFILYSTPFRVSQCRFLVFLSFRINILPPLFGSLQNAYFLNFTSSIPLLDEWKDIRDHYAGEKALLFVETLGIVLLFYELSSLRSL